MNKIYSFFIRLFNTIKNVFKLTSHCIIKTFPFFIAFNCVVVLFSVGLGAIETKKGWSSNGKLCLNEETYDLDVKVRIFSMFESRNARYADIMQGIKNQCDENNVRHSNGSEITLNEIKNSLTTDFCDGPFFEINYFTNEKDIGGKIVEYALSYGVTYTDLFIKKAGAYFNKEDISSNYSNLFPFKGVVVSVFIGIFSSVCFSVFLCSVSRRVLSTDEVEHFASIEKSSDIYVSIIKKKKKILIETPYSKEKIHITNSLYEYAKKRGLEVDVKENNSYAKTDKLVFVVIEGITKKQEIPSQNQENNNYIFVCAITKKISLLNLWRY